MSKNSAKAEPKQQNPVLQSKKEKREIENVRFRLRVLFKAYIAPRVCMKPLPLYTDHPLTAAGNPQAALLLVCKFVLW